ncbi:O-antigen ligase family protein [Ostreibacterium oceani]|nr:O-antigen ligase family protein [Ostreibacterium oceani]
MPLSPTASVSQKISNWIIPMGVYWLTGLFMMTAIVMKNGSQPIAFLLLLTVFPAFLLQIKGINLKNTNHHPAPWSQTCIPQSCIPQPYRLWTLMFLMPLMTSLPLAVTSQTGMPLDAPARYLAAWIVFIGLAYYSKKNIPLINPCWLLRAASIGVIIPIVWQFPMITSEARVNWGVGHLDSAYIGVALMALSITQLSLDRSLVWRCIGVIGASCALLLIIKTGTRGAWPAIILVCLLQLILLPRRNKPRLLNLFLFIIVLITAFSLSPMIKTRIGQATNDISGYTNDNNRQTSLGIRFDYWQVAMMAFKESPILGVSYPRRGELMQAYIEKNPASRGIGTSGRSSSHNEILQTLSTKGLVGLASLLLLYFVPLVFFIRHYWLAKKQQNSQASQTSQAKAPDSPQSCDQNQRNLRYLSMAGISIVVAFATCGLTEAPLFNVRSATFYGFTLVFLYHAITQINSALSTQQCSISTIDSNKNSATTSSTTTSVSKQEYANA